MLQTRQQLMMTTTSPWLALIVTASFLFTQCPAKHQFRAHTQSDARKRVELQGRGERSGQHSLFQQPPSQTEEVVSSRRKKLLNEAVSQLLGFDSFSVLPRPVSQFQSGRGWRPSAVPKYVLDLYERYRSGQMVGRPNTGNTVRSIPAEIGEVNGQSMFIFNLSSTPSTERLLRAHLHIYKRKRKSAHRKQRQSGDTEMILYDVTPNYLSQTGTIIMRSSVHGWQWYGVTDAVLSCLVIDREHPHALALAFRGYENSPRHQSRVNRRSVLKKFVKDHSFPFLILFSDETETVHRDIVGEKLKLNGDSVTQGSRKDDLDDEANDSKEIMKQGSGDIPDDYILKGTGDDISIDNVTIEQYFNGDSFRNDGTRNHHVTQRHTSKVEEKRPHDRNYGDGFPQNTLSSVFSLIRNTADQSSKVKETPKERKSMPVFKYRNRRSVLKNEIPQNQADYFKLYYRSNLLTNPAMLTPRNEHRQKLGQSHDFAIKRTETKPNRRQRKRKPNRRQRKRRPKGGGRRNRKNQRSRGSSDSQLRGPRRYNTAAPDTDSQLRGTRRDNTAAPDTDSQLRGTRRDNTAAPDTDSQLRGTRRDNTAAPDTNHKRVCSRHRLVVEFADIGWGAWIISPKSFEAHYCSGACTFPLKKWLRPSNHAAIQSILHTMGLHSTVPAPCCVPDTLTALTLLYFDDHQNVVLKNYPGMSVQSCACR